MTWIPVQQGNTRFQKSTPASGRWGSKIASLFLEYCFLKVGCFGTPGDTSGDTDAIGDANFFPSLSGNGDNFDGL